MCDNPPTSPQEIFDKFNDICLDQDLGYVLTASLELAVQAALMILETDHEIDTEGLVKGLRLARKCQSAPLVRIQDVDERVLYCLVGAIYHHEESIKLFEGMGKLSHDLMEKPWEDDDSPGS